MPRKRQRGAKGRGSVFQRKSDNRWVAQFIEEETGKQRQLYADSEKEAYQKLDKALAEQKQGILATGPKQKLGEYLTWWLDEVHRVKLRESSYDRYKIALEKHILPELGTIQLGKLTTRQVQMFYNKKLKEKQSPSSVYTMHKVLHGGLKRAVKLRYISYNPAHDVSLPANEPVRKGKSLTVEQAKHLLQVARGHRLEAFIALALTTGMRHGELTALRWEDINFEEGTIYIHRTAFHKGKILREGPPKTKKSEGVVPLVPAMYDLLQEHRVKQDEARLKAGPAWEDHGLVFCSIRGSFLYHVNTSASFHRLLVKAGLPRIPIHDLRHTASTIWQSMGIREKVVQELLRHSKLEMTRNVYTHVLPSMQDDAVNRINTLLQKPSENDKL